MTIAPDRFDFTLVGEFNLGLLLYGNLAGVYSTTAIGGVAAFQDRKAMQQFLLEHSLQVK